MFPCVITYDLTSEALDKCGNKGVSRPVTVNVLSCFGVAPPQIFSVPWTSQLDVAGATGRISLNDMLLATGQGRQQGITRARRGENRIDAELVQADGKPGFWRFELQGVVAPGSLRILSGEAVQFTDGVVVFQMAGNSGERVSFAFRVRD